MKKIINGKLYDTDTARELGVWSNTWDSRSWSYECETLYLKRTGEFFIHGHGGPQTKYAVSLDQNNWSSGEKIIPISREKAMEWAEKNLRAEEYSDIFGIPSEDEEDAQLHVVIPAQLMAALRAKASENGESLTSLVQRILKESV